MVAELGLDKVTLQEYLENVYQVSERRSRCVMYGLPKYGGGVLQLKPHCLPRCLYGYPGQYSTVEATYAGKFSKISAVEWRTAYPMDREDRPIFSIRILYHFLRLFTIKKRRNSLICLAFSGSNNTPQDTEFIDRWPTFWLTNTEDLNGTVTKGNQPVITSIKVID